MPSALAKACRVTGCPGGNCAHTLEARTQQADKRRGSSSARGYGAEWQRYTVWFRDAMFRRQVKNAGLCGARLPGTRNTEDSRCQAEGRITRGEVIDHITPVTGPKDPTFYDSSNHQLLCQSCHNAKRQRERR